MLLLLLDDEVVVVDAAPRSPRTGNTVTNDLILDDYPFAEKVNWCEEAKSFLVSQFELSERLKALACIFSEEIDEAELALWDLLDQLDHNQASGVFLDHIGAILNEPRGGLSDSDYLNMITAKRLALRSFGGSNDYISILRELIPGSVGVDCIEYFPHTAVIKLSDPVDENIDTMWQLLLLAKPAGYSLHLHDKVVATTETFRYSTVDGGTFGSDRGYGTGAFIDSRGTG